MNATTMLEFPTVSAHPHGSVVVQNESPSRGINYQKKRHPPSITPRKFARFFTPKTQRSIDSSNVLDDITITANNYRNTQSSPLYQSENVAVHEECLHSSTGEIKRRKLFHRSSTPIEHTAFENCFQTRHSSISDSEDLKECNSPTLPHIRNVHKKSDDISQEKVSGVASHRIQQLEDKGLSGKLLRFSLSHSTRSRRWDFIYPVSGKPSRLFLYIN
jgi:hypothetical protein